MTKYEVKSMIKKIPQTRKSFEFVEFLVEIVIG